MKKLLFTLALVVSFTTLGMSQFNFGAGAQLLFDGTVFGIQGKALYDVDETWRGAGAFTIHLEERIDWTIDLDAQYKLLEVSENFDLAPFAGLGITRYGFAGFSNSNTEIGINIGAFIDFVPSDSYHIYIEPKLNIGGYESFGVSGGILF